MRPFPLAASLALAHLKHHNRAMTRRLLLPGFPLSSLAFGAFGGTDNGGRVNAYVIARELGYELVRCPRAGMKALKVLGGIAGLPGLGDLPDLEIQAIDLGVRVLGLLRRAMAELDPGTGLPWEIRLQKGVAPGCQNDLDVWTQGVLGSLAIVQNPPSFRAGIHLLVVDQSVYCKGSGATEGALEIARDFQEWGDKVPRLTLHILTRDHAFEKWADLENAAPENTLTIFHCLPRDPMPGELPITIYTHGTLANLGVEQDVHQLNPDMSSMGFVEAFLDLQRDLWSVTKKENDPKHNGCNQITTITTAC